jgi:hypothetical protein
MIDIVWLQVLQRVPTDYYDSLAIITVTGAELVIQQIFKIERDFMVLRARTAGTGDLGRTVILAYGQIDFMAFNRKMSEEDVLKIFGEPMPEIERPQPVMYQAATMAPTTPLPPAPPAFVPIKPKPPAQNVAAAAETAEPPDEEAAPAQKPGQVSKTILLARLRERLAEKTR